MNKRSRIARKIEYVIRHQREISDAVTESRFSSGGHTGGGGHFDNYIIFCPNCGHRHENFSRHNFTYNFRNARPDSEECAPRSMTLALHEYKQGFILTIKAKTISLRIRDEKDFRATRYLDTRFEEIRFDLKKRQTTERSESQLSPGKSQNEKGGSRKQGRCLYDQSGERPLARRLLQGSLAF